MSPSSNVGFLVTLISYFLNNLVPLESWGGVKACSYLLTSHFAVVIFPPVFAPTKIQMVLGPVSGGGQAA